VANCKFWGPNHIFGTIVATVIKFSTRDDNPPPGGRDWGRDILNFCEISDNVFKTVQDRDMVTMED